jgi:hypothetical protein
MSEEKLKTIKVFITESYDTWVRRESIELNIEDYPELEGKTYEEIKEYVENNAEDMKATDDFFESLSEQLWDRDIERDKIKNEESAINVE